MLDSTNGGGFCNGAACVCETDEKRLATAARRAGIKESNAVTDMRRILDDQSVDAVFIATPDHWHAPAAILACEAGKVGNRRQLIFEMRLWSTNYPYNCDSGAEYLGTKGKMFVSKRGKLEILGERNQKIEAQPKEPPKLLAHREDFFDAIRTGRRPNADIEEGHRSVAVVHLANIAVRLGRSLEFDPQKEQVVGDEEASKLLSRKYRKEGHWAVPKGV